MFLEVLIDNYDNIIQYSGHKLVHVGGKHKQDRMSLIVYQKR